MSIYSQPLSIQDSTQKISTIYNSVIMHHNIPYIYPIYDGMY